MNTDDFIRTLTQDRARAGLRPERLWPVAVPMAIAAAAAVFIVLLGPRADLSGALDSARFAFKFAVTGALLVAAVGSVVEAGRPDGRLRWWPFAAVSAIAVGAAAIELLVLPSDTWAAAAVGNNARVCLVAIPLIGLAPLAIAIMTLRKCATVRPLWAGAMAGVLAGSIAAFFYAAHCTDDSPLFVVIWYSLAVAILAMGGAFAGRLLLRW